MKDRMFEEQQTKKSYHILSFYFFPECSDGTHGLECGYVCGTCSDGDWCNHVYGSCPNGCDVGVFGDTCDRGKMRRRKHRYTSYQHEFEIKEKKYFKVHSFSYISNGLEYIHVSY